MRLIRALRNCKQRSSTVSKRASPLCHLFGGSQKSGIQKGLSCSPEPKPERGYIRMFARNENRNEGTFACSPGTKNRNGGTFTETTLLRTRRFAASRFLAVNTSNSWRGAVGVKSTSVSQSVNQTSPNVFPPPKIFSKQGIWSSQFLRTSPKLFAALRGIHLHLCTPVLPLGQSKQRTTRFALHAASQITLPALQKTSVIFFLNLPGDLALKNGGVFWWMFCGLRFQGNKARKVPENPAKIRSKILVENLKDLGTFFSATFLTYSHMISDANKSFHWPNF